MPAGDKFSRNVHLVRGGLHGYCTHCPLSARRAALTRTVDKDGYATTVRRLNYIANLDKHRPAIHRVMRADLHWLEANYGAGGLRRE